MNSKIIAGIWYSLLSSFFFAVCAVFVKLAGEYCNAYFVSALRFIIGIILTIITVKIIHASFAITDKFSWIMRGITGSASMITYYIAIQYSGSGKATLLSNIYPAFTALFGPIFFHEKNRKTDWLAMPFCIAGAFVVFGGKGEESLIGDALAITSSIFAGFSVHFIRRSAQKENPVVIYLSACVFGLIAAPLAFSGKIEINMQSLIFIIIVGITAFAGQIFLNYCYKNMSAVKGSLLSFIKIPMTLGLSWFIGEKFGMKFMLGTLLIFSGIFIAGIPKIRQMKENKMG